MEKFQELVRCSHILLTHPSLHLDQSSSDVGRKGLGLSLLCLCFVITCILENISKFRYWMKSWVSMSLSQETVCGEYISLWRVHLLL